MSSPVLLGLVLASAAPRPVVVAVDGVLCDIVQTLVRGTARVTCLVAPGADPHRMALRGSDRAALTQAALVLQNGFNLTPAMRQVRLGQAPLAVAERAIPKAKAADPHVWHDPNLAGAMVQVSADSLWPLLGSAQGAALDRRRSAMQSSLEALGRWSAQQLRTVPSQQRVLVSSHRAFSSFARRYGLRELPVIDAFATGGLLRPSSLSASAKAIRASGTKAIFSEQWPPSKNLRRISAMSGVPLAKAPLYADGLAPGQSLVGTATANVCTFVTAQGGRCDRAGAARLNQQWEGIQ